MNEKRVERIAAKLVEAASDPVSLARQLAQLHKKAASDLDNVGDQYQKQMETASRAEDALLKALLRDASSIGSVLDILRENGINTGSLSSNVVDSLESLSNTKLSPAPWKVEEAKWAIVSV